MKFTGRASSSLRECWLIGFQLLAIETEFRIRVLCLQTKSLAGTPRSPEAVADRHRGFALLR